MNKRDEIQITKHRRISKKLILVLLIVFALGAWSTLIYDTYSHRLMRPLHHRPVRTLFTKKTPTAQDVQLIQPWMTFDYIDVVFNVPPDYLKTKLSITDPHYPHS